MLNKEISKNETNIKLDSQWSHPNKGLARLILKRKYRFDSELKAHPPEPPWDKHPGFSRSHQFWRTGAGNQYLMEYIWPFNRYSTKAARKLYRKAHPEPEGWVGWYSE